MFRLRNLLPLMVALFATASSADAGFQITLFANGSQATIVDGGVGDIDTAIYGSMANLIVVQQTVGGYTFNLTVAETNTPGGGFAFIDAGSNSISGTNAGTTPVLVGIVASGNGFAAPDGPVIVTSGSSATLLSGIGAPIIGSAVASYGVYIDNSNTLASSPTPGGALVGGGNIAGTGPTPTVLSKTNVTGSANDIEAGVASNPYTLTLLLEATISGKGKHSIDLDGSASVVSAVPAPAGLVLTLSALPLLGVGAWVRNRRLVVPTMA